MRRITIEFQPGSRGGNVIDEYGRETGFLCFGELLEQVVELAHPGGSGRGYQMLTPDEWAERERRIHERIEAARAATADAGPSTF
jgi:hypothetical protein